MNAVSDTVICHYPIPGVEMPEWGLKLDTFDLGYGGVRFVIQQNGQSYHPYKLYRVAENSLTLVRYNGAMLVTGFIEDRFFQHKIVFIDGVVLGSFDPEVAGMLKIAFTPTDTEGKIGGGV